MERNWFPVVLLNEDDYYVKLVEVCEYTHVVKFTNTISKMELVRKGFIHQNQLIRSLKIIYFNARHVYIDLDNEFDYQIVWEKLRMNIAGKVMRIQTWTRDFTPEEETTIAPFWVAIPCLPWHCYNKVLLELFWSQLERCYS